jgi:hypothetical protein
VSSVPACHKHLASNDVHVQTITGTCERLFGFLMKRWPVIRNNRLISIACNVDQPMFRLRGARLETLNPPLITVRTIAGAQIRAKA